MNNPFGIPYAEDFHCARCQTLLDGSTDEPVAARELRKAIKEAHRQLSRYKDKGPKQVGRALLTLERAMGDQA